MTLPPITLEIENDIPLGKGLGSSAAALTAGVVIADHLLGLHWKPHRILDEAAQASKGHPDNVAACVLGSIVASATDIGGVVRAVRVELPAQLRHRGGGAGFRAADRRSSRRCCPPDYSQEDAVFNVQRSALLDRRARHRHHQRLSGRARRPHASTLSLRAGAGPGGDGQAARARDCWDARSAAPVRRFWCSTNAAPSRCATWCGRSSRCTATNRKRCACQSPRRLPAELANRKLT